MATGASQLFGCLLDCSSSISEKYINILSHACNLCIWKGAHYKIAADINLASSRPELTFRLRRNFEKQLATHVLGGITWVNVGVEKKRPIERNCLSANLFNFVGFGKWGPLSFYFQSLKSSMGLPTLDKSFIGLD